MLVVSPLSLVLQASAEYSCILNVARSNQLSAYSIYSLVTIYRYIAIGFAIYPINDIKTGLCIDISQIIHITGYVVTPNVFSKFQFGGVLQWGMHGDITKSI